MIQHMFAVYFLILVMLFIVCPILGRIILAFMPDHSVNYFDCCAVGFAIIIGGCAIWLFYLCFMWSVNILFW